MASYKYHTTSQKSLSRDNGPLAQPQVVKKFTVIYIFIAQQPFFYLRCWQQQKQKSWRNHEQHLSQYWSVPYNYSAVPKEEKI